MRFRLTPARPTLLEQAYAIALNEPIASACCGPGSAPSGFGDSQLQHQRCQRFGGAVEDPERIAEIQEDDLLLLEGCTQLVSAADNGLKATGTWCRCLVKRKDHTTYLVSSFVLNPEGMDTIDRATADTHEHLWGSIAEHFDSHEPLTVEEIPGHWLHSS